MWGSFAHRLVALAALSTVLLSGARAQENVAELQAQFSKENDPVRKAKLLAKLGDAQFRLMRREADASNYAQALRALEDYRNEVHTAEAALKATGVDPERKPGGFKQLQIHVRKSLRELDQTILALPNDQQPPFEAARGDLQHVNKELIDLLFPRQPGKNADKEKPKG